MSTIKDIDAAVRLATRNLDSSVLQLCEVYGVDQTETKELIRSLRAQVEDRTDMCLTCHYHMTRCRCTDDF